MFLMVVGAAASSPAMKGLASTVSTSVQAVGLGTVGALAGRGKTTNDTTKTASASVQYKQGQEVLYTNTQGTCLAVVTKVHFDDKLQPYYTINLKSSSMELNGREKQTDNAHLSLPESSDADKENKHPNKKQKTKKQKTGTAKPADNGQMARDQYSDVLQF